MKSICVLGAGEAGISFIKELKGRTKDIAVTLIDKSKYYFSKRYIFDYLAGSRSNYLLNLEEFAQTHNIQFINAQVASIDARKRRIILKGKEKIEFESLLVATGLSNTNLSIPGDFREGFSYLSAIQPLAVKKFLKFSPHVTIFSSTFLGIRLAIHLASADREVKLFIDDGNYLGGHRDRVLEVLAARNIETHTNSRLEEVIGESMVKAVRTSLPKVFASELVFVDSLLVPNRALFGEEVITKDGFLTQFEDVFLVGDVTLDHPNIERFFPYNSEDAQAEGRLLSDYLLGGQTLTNIRRRMSAESVASVVEKALSVNVPSSPST